MRFTGGMPPPMDGDVVDIASVWRMMNDSNAGTMVLKFFKQEGDAKPFRVLVFASGAEEVANVLAMLATQEDAE